jgi:membrane fusion protein, copper/silver efflux system
MTKETSVNQPTRWRGYEERSPILIFAVAVLFGGILEFICLPCLFSVTSFGEAKAAQAENSSAQHQGHIEGNAPVVLKQEETFTDLQQTQTEETPTVEIPVEKQQMIGVRTITVAMRPMQTIVRAVGRIDYDERRLATINTKFEGWIEKLFVNVTGSFVKRGQPLAEVFSPELYATQQEFINTLNWAKRNRMVSDNEMQEMLTRDSDLMVEATKQRLKLWDISSAQIERIAETGQPIRTLTIQSPVNGVIIQKPVVQGMRVMPGEKLFDIADLSTVWIIADLYESQMSLVNIGQVVTISFNNFPGMVLSSAIDFVSPTLTGDTRTVRVRCTLANPKRQLKPQMFATMEIQANQGERLSVPDDAIIDTGTRKVVYVDKGEGMFEPREVITGLKSDGLTELTMGVEPGEKIASSANFLVDSEAQLKGISAPLHKH